MRCTARPIAPRLKLRPTAAWVRVDRVDEDQVKPLLQHLIRSRRCIGASVRSPRHHPVERRVRRVGKILELGRVLPPTIPGWTRPRSSESWGHGHAVRVGASLAAMVGHRLPAMRRVRSPNVSLEGLARPAPGVNETSSRIQDGLKRLRTELAKPGCLLRAAVVRTCLVSSV